MKKIIYSLLQLILIVSLTTFSYSCDKDNELEEPEQQEEEQQKEDEDPVLSSEKEIVSFYFPSAGNNLDKDLKPSISNGLIEFNVSTWIDNPQALIASFTAKGKVTVDGVDQVSGETPNDFTKEVLYTVTAEDDSKITYTVRLNSPQLTGIPVFKVDTENKAPILDKENYVHCTLTITDYMNEENNVKYEMKENGIRGRGNSTWGYAKKPYRIKLDKKGSVLGLKEEKSWVLLANYLDPTLLMNTIAFELGSRFGMPFTNHCRPVELFLNGVHKGSYLLTEQVEVSSNRVNVNKNTGYLIEMDSYFDEDWKFKTEGFQLPVMLKSPDYNETMDKEIKQAFKDLESALLSSSFPNTNYRDLIDVPSLINYLIVYELTRNIELKHPKSTYMHKEATGKFFMGPIWDFDWAFGYAEYGFVYFNNPKTMLYKAGLTGSDKGNKYFSRYFDDPAFRKQYKERWNELKDKQIKTIPDFIDQQAAVVYKSQEFNFKIWNNNLTYSNEISKMKTFWKERVDYLDSEINKW